MTITRICAIGAIVAVAALTSCGKPKTDPGASASRAAGGDSASAQAASQSSPSQPAASPSGQSAAPAPAGAQASPAAVVHVAEASSVQGTLSGKSGPAPDFSWKDAAGTEHSLHDYRGKVVMINFWGTWCGPCRGELPDIVKIRQEMQDKGFEVIGLNVNEQPRADMTAPQYVAAFAQQNGLYYPLVLASDELVEAYGGIEAVPTMFIVNGKGNVVKKLVGRQSDQAFRDAINAAM
ncbi:MAG TPA: TlpA disulfide reductase family protein [Candidatus Kapabacteria bacterium]|nr:TlpA disulfide reductase family protein [Candidatus Kapabacteria bacterium]